MQPIRIRRKSLTKLRGPRRSIAQTAAALLVLLSFTTCGFGVYLGLASIVVVEEHSGEKTSEVRVPDVLVKRFRPPVAAPKARCLLTVCPVEAKLFLDSQNSQLRASTIAPHFLGAGIRIRC